MASEEGLNACLVVATRIAAVLFSVSVLLAGAARAEYTSFRPGEVWLDTSGNVMQVHGGSVIYHQGVYYWYGTEYAAGGQYFTCYSSTDLYNWKYEGYALQVNDSIPDLGSWMANGRAHVKHNPATGKFALWLHVDEWTGLGTGGSRAGVAVSDTPTDLFQYLSSFIPVTHPGKEDAFRDDNLFVDDDGRAYVFYSSGANQTMYVVRLSADFLDIERPAVEDVTWARNLIDRGREAPAPFKYDGRYYLITSGCTGWAHNAADCAVSTTGPLGPCVPQGNPCVGPASETTFESQSTCVFPVAGKPAGSFIFVADRWNGSNLGDSRYIWLPLLMQADGTFQLQWLDEWDLSVFGTSVPPPPDGPGTGILREVWTGIAGSSVNDLTSSPDYPANPSSSGVATSFKGPVNWAENYGTRFRGYVIAPVTGTYYFWIASDDDSKLILSTSQDPAGAVEIASVAGHTGSREWTKFASQKSAAMSLIAGQRYYIEALHKEGDGGDNICVRWQFQGGAMEGPIPGHRLDPYTPASGPAMALSPPSLSFGGTEGGPTRRARTSPSRIREAGRSRMSRPQSATVRRAGGSW